jgi:mycothione reductase
VTHYDLAIIGSGSGNSLVTPDFDHKQVAVIEAGVFGGTCLNVGCIPTKMYVYPADVATAVGEVGRLGVDAHVDGVRWREIRDRIFGRIDPISAGGLDYRRDGANTTALLGRATFTGPRAMDVDVDGTIEHVTADQVVIAAGTHADVPPEVAESGVPFHTSDTIMRIDELPRRLLILGSGFIGAEFAHVFGAFGTEVTMVGRSNAVLRHLDAEISQRFTELARGRWDVRLETKLVKVTGDAVGVRLHFADGTHADGDVLLVATGRTANTRGVGLDLAGVELHDDGRVKVDEHGRTTAEGVWALGDVSSPYQLKHVANHEARIVAHNLAHPGDLRPIDHRFVPEAVFTHPQVAAVGLTEEEARAAGHDVVTKVQDYGDTAYGWAMEDRTGVCKLVAERTTGQLLGAHIMGHEASMLIQPLVQGMYAGQTVREMAQGQYWIHPALTEVVENALLGLELAPDADTRVYPLQ